MNNTRISNVVLVPTGEMEAVVNRTPARIDNIHAVPDVGRMSLDVNEGSQFGGYVPEREDELRHLTLSWVGPYPELTLTHEIGHFLDHALGGFRVYLSKEPGSMLTDVLRATEQSRAIREMRAALQTGTNLTQIERYQLLYWLDAQEQWARAYAQFIATRLRPLLVLASGNRALFTKATDVSERAMGSRRFCGDRCGIEATFRKLGWMP